MRRPRISVDEHHVLALVNVAGEGPDPGYTVGSELNYRGTSMRVTDRTVVGDTWSYTFESVPAVDSR